MTPSKEGGRITDYQQCITDPGVDDKRLLISESEFGRALKAARRPENTLTAVIRQAWDSGTMNILTKTLTTATNAHISIIGHITATELQDLLTHTDIANGFLFVWAERARKLPLGGSLDEQLLGPIADRIRKAGEHAKKLGRLTFDEEAEDDWKTIYEELSEGESLASSAQSSVVQRHR
jgi:hypothetical protein